MRDPRHDILFEPLKIGPVTTRNRFYRAHHCTGMGWRRPQALAAMQSVKAEGGRGVVNTEYCAVHPTSEDDAFPFAALWDDMVMNLGTRLPSYGLRNRPQTDVGVFDPGQTRKMDKQDIRAIRGWRRDAARRAVEAGFDIVYVYATHEYLLSEFLDPSVNNRTDEYGGSLENLVRIVRKLIEEPREAVEGALQDSVAHAKSLTSKRVVGVGCFTSPDTMAQVIKAGQQDLIGAARPSIVDSFLPRKIEEGRIENIRECIGCNICYALDPSGAPLRRTQNPTIGEEWRLGWHPGRAGRAETPEKMLVRSRSSKTSRSFPRAACRPATVTPKRPTRSRWRSIPATGPRWSWAAKSIRRRYTGGGNARSDAGGKTVCRRATWNGPRGGDDEPRKICAFYRAGDGADGHITSARDDRAARLRRS